MGELIGILQSGSTRNLDRWLAESHRGSCYLNILSRHCRDSALVNIVVHYIHYNDVAFFIHHCVMEHNVHVLISDTLLSKFRRAGKPLYNVDYGLMYLFRRGYWEGGEIIVERLLLMKVPFGSLHGTFAAQLLL